MSVIANDADIKRGMDFLAEICPHMRMIGETLGPPPLRWREHGFAGMVSTITHSNSRCPAPMRFATSCWRGSSR